MVWKTRKRGPKRRRAQKKMLIVGSLSLIILIIFCTVVGVLVLLQPPGCPVKVGENQTYSIYDGPTRRGSLTLRITNTETVENAECYVARYSLMVDETTRSGKLEFDKNGNLRDARIEEVENLSLKWRTEVNYSFAEALMRVIFQDNRNPEDYLKDVAYINLTEEIMVPEHIWYLIRLESLHQGYRREFYINLLPNATFNTSAAIQVVGEETLETPAGRFDCWVLEGENTQLAPWPIDKLWVAKNERVVVKAVEDQAGAQIEYLLESYE